MKLFSTTVLTKAAAVIAAALMSFSAFAQQRVTVTGQVVDVNSEPVIGAGVMQKGSTNGTVTDLDGKYSLSVPQGSVIEFSCIGYKNQEITAPNGGGTLNVTLAVDDLMIEETVVVGYGVQKKSDLTGAISSLKSEDLANRSVTDVASLLQGKSAGVQILQTGGAPGSAGTIHVRGVSSNGSSSPLFIVDGLKVPSLDYVNSENIESMEVLKDGASAAIYGAEAGNGVILITTKKAKNGDGRVFFDAQYSLSSLAKKAEVLNAKQYIGFMTELGAMTQAQIEQNYYNIPSVNGTDVDWQDEMYKTGYNKKYTVGVEAANDKASFFTSITYNDQDGMVYGDADIFNSLSSQVNASYKVKKWLTVGITNTIQRTKQRAISQSNVSTGQITGILQYDPITPIFYKGGESAVPYYVADAILAGYSPFRDKETGDYYGSSFWNQSANGNPRAMVKFMQTAGTTTLTRMNGTFYADITPLKGLVFTSRFGYRLGSTYTYAYLDPYWSATQQISSALKLNTSTRTSLYYQWENFANYNVSVGKSNFGAMAGVSYIRSVNTSETVQTDGLTSMEENYRYPEFSLPSADDKIGGTISKMGQLGYFSRLSWSYDNRYNVMFNFRADAYDLSKLHQTNRWGYFPSISGGWTLSNEEFVKDILDKTPVSFIKIRASYGINGNVSNLNNYAYASTVQNGMNYITGGNLIVGTYPSAVLANPDLRWEKSKQVDLGLDTRMFSDRLTLSVDYFNKNTDGLLVSVTPPLTTGATSMMKNLGIVNNHGLELDLGWKDQISKDFSYSINGNISSVKNMVTKFRGEDQREAGASVFGSTVSYFEEGHPVWYFRTYNFQGVDPKDGSPIIEDVNHDGNITELDRVDNGSPIPAFTYGINLALSYKNFDLSIAGAGSQGGKLLLAANRNGFPLVNRYAFEYTDRWTPQNTNASRPAPTNKAEYYTSTAWLFDASFFKIKQIQVGYNLPSKYASKIGLSKCRVFFSLDDFFTFTKYPGLDPETRTDSTSSMGIDQTAYPIQKSVLMGLNIAF